jgi:hypothetical protein
MLTFAQKQNRPQKPTSSSRSRPNMATLGPDHTEHPIFRLRRTIGNQAVRRMLQTHAEVGEEPDGELAAASPRFGHDFSRIPIPGPTAVAIQTKLTINEPGNEYEQEADRISELVMQVPERKPQGACACGGACPKCQAKRADQGSKPLQTKRVSSSDPGQTAAPTIIQEVLRSSGQPLEAATRAFMEPRFGHDFSQVRIHADAAAAESAWAVDAPAYAAGRHIVFGAGRYAPHTVAGRHLLAHELAHVLHQDDGRVYRKGSGVKLGQPTISTDREAARRKGEELRKVIESGKWDAKADQQLAHWLDFFEGEALTDFINYVSPGSGENSLFGGETTYLPDRDRVAVEPGSLVIPKSEPREVRGGFSVAYFAQAFGEESHSTSVEVYTDVSEGGELGVELPIKKIAKFKFSVSGKIGRKDTQKRETKDANRSGMTINRNYKVIKVERNVFRADFLKTMHGISKPDIMQVPAGQLSTKSSSKLTGYSPQEIQAGYKIVPQEGGPAWGRSGTSIQTRFRWKGPPSIRSSKF